MKKLDKWKSGRRAEQAEYSANAKTIKCTVFHVFEEKRGSQGV